MALLSLTTATFEALSSSTQYCGWLFSLPKSPACSGLWIEIGQQSSLTQSLLAVILHSSHLASILSLPLIQASHSTVCCCCSDTRTTSGLKVVVAMCCETLKVIVWFDSWVFWQQCRTLLWFQNKITLWLWGSVWKWWRSGSPQSIWHQRHMHLPSPATALIGCLCSPWPPWWAPMCSKHPEMSVMPPFWTGVSMKLFFKKKPWRLLEMILKSTWLPH